MEIHHFLRNAEQQILKYALVRSTPEDGGALEARSASDSV
jgi:hypothetical protein